MPAAAAAGQLGALLAADLLPSNPRGCDRSRSSIRNHG